MDIEEYRKRFGSLITRMRIERNMSIADVARAIGLSGPAISQWERGTTLPDTENRLKLGVLLDHPFDDEAVQKEPIRDYEKDRPPRVGGSVRPRLPDGLRETLSKVRAKPDMPASTEAAMAARKPLDEEIQDRLARNKQELAAMEARKEAILAENRRLKAALAVFTEMDQGEEAGAPA